MQDYLHYKKRKLTTRSRIKPLRVLAYLLGFLGLSLIAGGLFFITKSPHQVSTIAKTPSQAVTKPQNTTRDQVPKTPNTLTQDKKLSFDFYHILPQRKTAIATDTAKDSNTPNANRSTFSVQVASYRQIDQAQKLADLLKKWQLPASISHQDNQDWFAVVIGPCSQMRDCEAYQNLLQKKGLHGSIMRSDKSEKKA